ncbi:hemagglutinin-neuraminidase protein [Salmon aquaparamyxovirus]|uniref:Hemagglutinin-neuraminidase n=2 Tax=Salmon aquaparamyxovirus TaxID=381543 RepID=B1NLR8_9MONO|nr:hemagglutinin-neuraminidase protein [Salmon aquaparamyxovirus]ABW38055.1 hemagglutinin-neuraminidase [Salmon aquaparamyxovirus]ABX57742.1 hemagglutinin-neuraminidase protein [Salmon aquaparamyxovirus]
MPPAPSPVHDPSSFYGSSLFNEDTASRKGTSEEIHLLGIRWNTVLIVLGLILAIIGIGIGASSFSASGITGNTTKEIRLIVEEMSYGLVRISDSVRQEISPKVTLLQNAVLSSIPALVTTETNTIINAVKNHCNSPPTPPPPTEAPLKKHETGMAPLDPTTYWTCTSGTPRFYSSPNATFIPGPSPLPHTATPGGCVRIPSMHIGSEIYAYTSNLIASGCQDIGKSYQNVQIGVLDRTPEGNPEMSPMLSHTFPINDNRKSCSIVTLKRAAYIYCSQPKVTEFVDYQTPGIEPMSLDHINANGTTKTWIYSPTEVVTDVPYASMYPSVGSGVVIDGKLVFLVYGGLLNGIQVPAMCLSPECPGIDQAACNASQYNQYLSGRQVVNGIATVDLMNGQKPHISVETISPSKNWFGAEGRLVYMGGRLYIYIRSTGWHSPIQIGVIYTMNPLAITWVTNTVLSRPGSAGCDWNNRCPKACLSGVYTDAYPISPDYNHLATMILHSTSTRSNPVMVYSSPTNMVNYAQLTTTAQIAGYTTTSCFTDNEVGYCATALELTPGTLSSVQPILVMTKIPKECV